MLNLDSDYIITTQKLPDDGDRNVILSNAFVGHRMHGETVFMNGLYNGFTTSCHRARIPCPIPYIDEEAISYTLDCKKATYTVTGSSFEQVFYAHSVANRVFVTEISVNSGSVKVNDHHGAPSVDLDVISFVEGDFVDQVNDTGLREVNVFHGQIKAPETKASEKLNVFVVTTALPNELSEGSHISISSFGYSYNEALEFYNLAVAYYNNGILSSTHQQTWNYMWNTSNIDTDNRDFSKTIKTALFYLLSSFPAFALAIPELDNKPFDFYGVSPGSLGNGGKDQDYWGHVFWDQDLWMLPAVMLLFPELVRQSIKYRVAMLPGAQTKAKTNGYRGAMYPWESARTGIDVCPGEIYAKYQQHVTACVVYAIRQYVYVTGSWAILQNDGAWDVIKETADFWVSRVKWDGDKYVINHVMDPDEYHYNVDNSCFTNAAARLNLLFAIEAAGQLGRKPDPCWVTISQEDHGIQIPFDEKLRYHPEYDGYTQGTKIKQASVVLLGYPLGYQMDDDVRRNDILVYEKCTANGPAMTYSMYSIGMLELGELELAEKLFKIQFGNIRPPFRIWNEYAGAMGCANFLTGIGGFLQSVLFGYLGLRVFEKKLQVEPNIIPDCSTVSYTGIGYHGEHFNFIVDSKGFRVCRTTGNAFQLWVIEKSGGSKQWPLVTHQEMLLPLGKYSIFMSDGYEMV